MAMACSGTFVYIVDNFIFLLLYDFAFRVDLERSLFRNSVS